MPIPVRAGASGPRIRVLSTISIRPGLRMAQRSDGSPIIRDFMSRSTGAAISASGWARAVSPSRAPRECASSYWPSTMLRRTHPRSCKVDSRRRRVAFDSPVAARSPPSVERPWFERCSITSKPRSNARTRLGPFRCATTSVGSPGEPKVSVWFGNLETSAIESGGADADDASGDWQGP